MLNYVGTNAVITYNFEFCQMTRWEGEDNLKGYIRFDNSHYLTNISDTNLIGDGYVNLSDGIIYWRKSKYQEYYSYEDNTVFIKDYNNQKSFARITYYDEDALVANLYKFYANIESGEDPGGGGGGGDTPSTSVTDPSLVSIEHTELRCREKQQVRPSDHSQDWTDTDVVRDKEECDVQVDSCECGREYQWVSVGTICDGVNKCDKLKYQYKDECNGSWNDYSPLIYKIGDVIEYDSSECGTVEYKEEWSEPFCGSYLNDKYGLSLSSVNKYKIKIPYIKRKDEFVWSELNCNTLLEYELFYANSFECGYKTTRTTYTYDNDLCGSAVKQKYPSLSGVIDTNRYKVTITHKEETAPYPTNTDDMEQSEWVWVETGTSYSYSVTTSNDCGCDWVGTKYVTGNTVYCGRDLKNTIVGDDILTVTSYEGDWYKNPEYDLYTSNRIGKNEKTKIRINFNMATSGSVVINFNISSESWDKLYIGFIDADISEGYSSYGGSSSLNGNTNYYTFSNVSSGNHWIELEYRKDDSVDSGRDNVTVYLSSKYASFNKYQIAEEYEYCGNTLFNKTGNYKLINYSSNSISTMFNCGWSSISYFVSDEKECGYRLGDGYTPTTEYTKIKAYEYSNLTSGFTSGDTESLLPYAIDDFYYWSATTTNSYTCGYQGSDDFDTGEDSCCGSLGEELQILKVEGLGEGSWHQEGDFYFPYPLTATGETAQLKIHFKSNSGIRVHINATSSNGMNYMVSQLDSETSYSQTQSTATTINRTVEDEDDHFIIVKIKYTNQNYLNYIPMVRFSVYADCEPFYEYNIYETKYTTDGKNYQSYNPPKYKYYSKTSNSPKEECGYKTYIEQFVEMCPDITYADVEADRSLLGYCANCVEYNGVNALFAVQFRQISYDLGLTWITDYSYIDDETKTYFRKGRLLRKSDTELGDLC